MMNCSTGKPSHIALRKPGTSLDDLYVDSNGVLYHTKETFVILQKHTVDLQDDVRVTQVIDTTVAMILGLQNNFQNAGNLSVVKYPLFEVFDPKGSVKSPTIITQDTSRLCNVDNTTTKSLQTPALNIDESRDIKPVPNLGIEDKSNENFQIKTRIISGDNKTSLPLELTVTEAWSVEDDGVGDDNSGALLEIQLKPTVEKDSKLNLASSFVDLGKRCHMQSEPEQDMESISDDSTIDNNLDISESEEDNSKDNDGDSSGNFSDTLSIKQTFDSKASKVKRFRSRETGNYSCDKCGKSYIRKKSYSTHLSQCTGPDTHKGFKCVTCGESFSLFRQLKTHIEIHGPLPQNSTLISTEGTHPGESAFKCPDCGKAFFEYWKMYWHQERHGEKTFICDQCGKAFHRKEYMLRHVKNNHSMKEKPKYTCEICGKKCSGSRKTVEHHILSVHKGEKRHFCPICGNGYYKKQNCDVHFLSHSTIDVSVSCKICSKVFKRAEFLRRHQKVHLGEKPFACEFCDFKARLKTTLVAHRRTHTGEKPFQCEICGRGFSQKNSVKLHKRNVHKDQDA